jgi:hypothetical protein
MDCPRPSYLPEHGIDPSESLHFFQEWKHACYIHCLAPVLDNISQPNLTYDTVLDLDMRIRDFAIPASLRNKDINTKSIVMQRASLSTALEAVLLQLHRTFFTRALSGPEEAFNRKHKYAPSVVAVFLSATRMIANIQELYEHEPYLTARILGYWSNAFSAAVALCLLVSRAPFTCLSPAALQELERARILFRAAKDICPRAQQVIHVLETMIDKANFIYNRWSDGQDVPTIVLRHITDDGSADYENSPPASYGTLQNSGSAYGQQQQTMYGGQQVLQQPSQQHPPPTDSFGRTHRSLAQCVVEAHQRAKALYPLRKPCQCANKVAPCPPSHSWMPPPKVGSQLSPVLPPELPGSNAFARASPTPTGFGTSNGHGVMSDGAPRGYSPATMGSPSSPYTHAHNHSEGIYSNVVLPSNGPPIPAASMTLSPTSKMAVVDTINFELGALNSSSDQNWMSFF